MDFKHPNGSSVPVMVPRRSLLVMGGESRYLWTHGYVGWVKLADCHVMLCLNFLLTL